MIVTDPDARLLMIRATGQLGSLVVDRLLASVTSRSVSVLTRRLVTG